jgi:hypothetical protein
MEALCMAHSVYGLKHYDVGDLVFFKTGHLDPLITNRKLGVVKEVRTDRHIPRYVIYWFRDELFSEHVANNLDLVYNKKVD